MFCLWTMIQSTTFSAVILVTGGVEKNPGPGVEPEKNTYVLCNLQDTNFKSETQCDTYGRWLHNNSGNLNIGTVYFLKIIFNSTNECT